MTRHTTFVASDTPKAPVDAYSIIDKLEWNTPLYCFTAHFERMPDPN